MTNGCIKIDNFLALFTIIFLKLWACDREGKKKAYDKILGQINLVF
jgi:hypothetical protein